MPRLTTGAVASPDPVMPPEVTGPAATGVIRAPDPRSPPETPAVIKGVAPRMSTRRLPLL